MNPTRPPVIPIIIKPTECPCCGQRGVVACVGSLPLPGNLPRHLQLRRRGGAK